MCSCDFLFWNRVLIPTYFAEVYQNPSRARGLQYMMMAISDTRTMVERCLHHSATLVQTFEREVDEALKEVWLLFFELFSLNLKLFLCLLFFFYLKK